MMDDLAKVSMIDNRIVYIDQLRGFAIICVVIGHALELNGYADSFTHRLIYSFHMPLFFCISGFVLMHACSLNGKSDVSDYGSYIWKKFLGLILPYIFWSIFVYPFFFAQSFDFSVFISVVKNVLIYNRSNWFFPCLFNLSAIFVIWKLVIDRLGRSCWVLDIFLLIPFLWGGYFCPVK